MSNDIYPIRHFVIQNKQQFLNIYILHSFIQELLLSVGFTLFQMHLIVPILSPVL
jgi:hypothetical protein